MSLVSIVTAYFIIQNTLMSVCNVSGGGHVTVFNSTRLRTLTVQNSVLLAFDRYFVEIREDLEGHDDKHHFASNQNTIRPRGIVGKQGRKANFEAICVQQGYHLSTWVSVYFKLAGSGVTTFSGGKGAIGASRTLSKFSRVAKKTKMLRTPSMSLNIQYVIHHVIKLRGVHRGLMRVLYVETRLLVLHGRHSGLFRASTAL